MVACNEIECATSTASIDPKEVVGDDIYCRARRARRTHPASKEIPRQAFLFATASTATIASTLIPAHFDLTDHKTYPSCNPQTLPLPSQLPLFLRPLYTCETLLFFLAAATVIHWISVFNLFNQERWRNQYYPFVFCVILGCLIPAALFVDLATLSIQVLPTICDICVLLCLLVDSARMSTRG